MKAAVVTQTGVEIREVPAPVPGRNHVLVRVRACGLNRTDLYKAKRVRDEILGKEIVSAPMVRWWRLAEAVNAFGLRTPFFELG